MDYSSANLTLWGFMIQIGILSGALLLSDFFLRRIKLIQKLMMPSAVLAGFILLILKQLGLTINESLMEILVFHGIALGFIAMSLRVPPKKTDEQSQFVGLKSGALIVSTYLVQGIVGLLITMLLGYTIMPNLFKAAGVLLPMGYGQGPGQANNIGSSYEALGFNGGRSFGMSIAAAGYIVACVVGVIILNIIRKKGLLQEQKITENKTNYYDSLTQNTANDSIDILSLQLALVLFVYLITYYVIHGLTLGIRLLSEGAAGTIVPLIWGFNFIIASAIAILVRALMMRSKNASSFRLLYQNNYLLNRISGFFFDIMIVAGIASINIEDIRGLWLPFILLVVIGGVVTWFYLSFMCKKIYPDYYYQGLISMFGMLTGTISSGVLLLREVDHEFETPAANNLITGSSFGIIFGAPILILVGIAPRSEASSWLAIGIMIVYLFLLLFVIFKVKRKTK